MVVPVENRHDVIARYFSGIPHVVLTVLLNICIFPVENRLGVIPTQFSSRHATCTFHLCCN